jgi:hypothetical protein
MKGRKLN